MNTILVSQGHEKSIGLEVFIKSFLLLKKVEQNKFLLHCFKASLIDTLDTLSLDYNLLEKTLNIGDSTLRLKFLKTESYSQSFLSLESCVNDISNNDILVTIPTSKEELKDETHSYTGHTDYFRKKYTSNTPVMLFNSENLSMALITEHICLSSIESSISYELITNKIKSIIDSDFKFERFVFTGINPHCGDNGLLGNSDKQLIDHIQNLREEYPKLIFELPISGDTFLCNTKEYSQTDCLIAIHHDQGLAPFKAISGIRASNITLGLPFLRLSPDHGTAFNLYGKNKANYFGMLFTLNKALRSL